MESDAPYAFKPLVWQTASRQASSPAAHGDPSSAAEPSGLHVCSHADGIARARRPRLDGLEIGAAWMEAERLLRSRRPSGRASIEGGAGEGVRFEREGVEGRSQMDGRWTASRRPEARPPFSEIAQLGSQDTKAKTDGSGAACLSDRRADDGRLTTARTGREATRARREGAIDCSPKLGSQKPRRRNVRPGLRSWLGRRLPAPAAAAKGTSRRSCTRQTTPTGTTRPVDPYDHSPLSTKSEFGRRRTAPRTAVHAPACKPLAARLSTMPSDRPSPAPPPPAQTFSSSPPADEPAASHRADRPLPPSSSSAYTLYDGSGSPILPSSKRSSASSSAAVAAAKAAAAAVDDDALTAAGATTPLARQRTVTDSSGKVYPTRPGRGVLVGEPLTNVATNEQITYIDFPDMDPEVRPLRGPGRGKTGRGTRADLAP